MLFRMIKSDLPAELMTPIRYARSILTPKAPRAPEGRNRLCCTALSATIQNWIASSSRCSTIAAATSPAARSESLSNCSKARGSILVSPAPYQSIGISCPHRYHCMASAVVTRLPHHRRVAHMAEAQSPHHRPRPAPVFQAQLAPHHHRVVQDDRED